jgi:CRISPR-associated protein Cas5h
MSIAVQVLCPVKKIHMAFNLINTKTSFYDIDNRTQIEFEFLKSPAFRIFFQHTDKNIFETLAERIAARKYHFTPCLGIAQLSALVDIHGILPCKTVENKLQTSIEVISAVNLSLLNIANPVHFGTGYYTVDTYPRILRRDREVSEFAEILVERKGGTIEVKCPLYWEVQGLGNILFL